MNRKNVFRVVLAMAAMAFANAASASTIYQAFIEVHRASDGVLLGYAGNTTTSGLTPIAPIANALLVTFTLGTGVTAASDIDLLTLNSSTAFDHFGLIQGRDDANSTLQPGSFHYAYVSMTSATPPNSTPQTVGNSYTTATGTSRTSESAVWTLDILTGSLFPVWTNPDGSTPLLDLFSQSNFLYSGGDASLFLARFPAPITPYTLALSIQSQQDVPDSGVPEPTSLSMMTLGIFGLGMLARRKKSVRSAGV